MQPQFRTCPDTGLVFHRPAENLIKANAVAAVVFLAVGGLLGLLVALTRWPAVQILNAEDFYTVLTGHGVVMLLVWILFFEVALLYFCSSVLLRCRIATPRLGWVAFALMIIGAAITSWAIIDGSSSVMMTSYVPMPAAPSFYFGLILFAVGALIGVFMFFGTLAIARDEKTYEGSIPLVTFGALTAAILAVFTIACGAIILIPTWLWSIGYISEIDPLMYRLVWWGLGHTSQQINVAAHVSVWYAVAAIVFNAKPMSEKVSRGAFFLYILFISVASAHHLLGDPGLSTEWKIFNTSYVMYLAVLASLVHGLTVPGSIEVAQREKGHNKGLFEWLRKAPWGNPVFSGMFLSLVGFGFIGGISGVVMGSEQVNFLIHNTIYVPGHFHATVVLGTTLAFMAMSLWLVPVLFRRKLFMPGLAKWQPWLFGIGTALQTFFMMGAGTLGVSRRHWDMAFTGSAFEWTYPGMAYTMMALNGISAIIAVLGGIAFVVVIVGTVLFGQKTSPAEYSATRPGILLGPAESLSGHSHVGLGVKGFPAPGTFVLAMFLLLIFVVYFFVNYGYLASVWRFS
ncbi:MULTISPECIES: cbb3-type cytochrome c oxidase subunit I [unclassified Wenzhouxiangella]|uniref:cbb3-type cytochrome c oxidase subunit I n=1 Tax=unclassified Wenzhouxiangella TaxID=2613841 RepID=UPI000E329CC3|nr:MULTISPECIES: cbb3-type cytochrome c oxidase subunit I [unclassified Wenzhouxiangella]RFF27370.1 cytochrome C oxidase subunit I [Wenzhouxiangella sp. 15181]RFP68798.1 cytochrome C oxidase subunit I [Wenzhouxiangella sp. 15190]